MNTPYNGYRMLTLLVPLNPHDNAQDRCRNVKLSGVLRWYMYTRFPGNYYRLSPQADSRLRHGALCISAKRNCKWTETQFYEFLALEQLLGYLRRENLCSCVQILDDNGTGAATPLPLICMSGDTDKPICPDAAQLHKGPSMDPAHIPYFARQMLLLMRDKPVEQCNLPIDAYNRHFSLK